MRPRTSLTLMAAVRVLLESETRECELTSEA